VETKSKLEGPGEMGLANLLEGGEVFSSARQLGACRANTAEKDPDTQSQEGGGGGGRKEGRKTEKQGGVEGVASTTARVEADNEMHILI
jgi:hypothetical protein